LDKIKRVLQARIWNAHLLGFMVGTFWLQRKPTFELSAKDFPKERPIC
jgi:hypothetical protein